jgi:hypothetical protein
LASNGRVSAVDTVIGRVDTPLAFSPGGTTRSTCPTSITFGFSRLFQRAMSRQF